MDDERAFTAERLLSIEAERQVSAVERVPWIAGKVVLADPPPPIALCYGHIARRKLKKHTDHFRQLCCAGKPCCG
jgi:hypothetical protein